MPKIAMEPAPAATPLTSGPTSQLAIQKGQYISYPEGRISYDEASAEELSFDPSLKTKIEEAKSISLPLKPTDQWPKPQSIPKTSPPVEPQAPEKPLPTQTVVPPPSISSPMVVEELDSQKKVDQLFEAEDKLTQINVSPQEMQSNIPPQEEVKMVKPKTRFALPQVFTFPVLRIVLILSIIALIGALGAFSFIFLDFKKEPPKKITDQEIEEQQFLSGEFVFPPPPQRPSSGFESILRIFAKEER